MGLREAILRAAVRRFGDQGFGATRVSDIARDVGHTKAALYYHFDSKERLWHESLQGVTDSLGRALEPCSAARELTPWLSCHLEALGRWAQQHPDASRMLVRAGWEPHRDEVLEGLDERWQEFRERFGHHPLLEFAFQGVVRELLWSVASGRELPEQAAGRLARALSAVG